MNRSSRTVLPICPLVLLAACGRLPDDQSDVDAPAGAPPPAVIVEAPPLRRAPAARTEAVLDWQPCAEGFQCATLEVPRDYAQPEGPTLKVAITRLPARLPARRAGALFLNFGGPGSSTLSILQSGAGAFIGARNPTFDIVGVDPRGTGQTEGAVDCRVDQELDGPNAQPFFTPETLDLEALQERSERYIEACVANNDLDLLAYASTANTARDMDAVRSALGDEKLNYLGYSYGTVLGATYASLFPHNYRAMVLDGAVDPDAYMNGSRAEDPALDQLAAFERALGRFFQACAADQKACSEFGGSDPERAFDDLVARAHATPIPAGELPPVDGDDILTAMVASLYSKAQWQPFAAALAEAQAGDATLLREIADGFYDRAPDGSYEPSTDRLFALQVIESSAAPTELETVLARGDESFLRYEHVWWGNAYSELLVDGFPVRAQGVFRGPFRVPADAAPILVVGTTFDPATPYANAERLVSQLDNARLLTMNGDGHGAYLFNSRCIDGAVENYLARGLLPAIGSECQQEVPFALPEAEPSDTSGLSTAVFPDPSRSAEILPRPRAERWPLPLPPARPLPLPPLTVALPSPGR
jgi:pimeloyl-ACP methyl ester carboxylesterase